MHQHKRVRLSLSIVSLLVLLLVLSACGSNGGDNDAGQAPSPTQMVEPTATATTPDVPTATAEPATATPTSTQPLPATETPVPEPSPTATATNTPAPTFQPSATPLAGADDVWNLRQFEIDEPVMVLTFDAGADRGYAEQILDTLAAEGIHASFGMTGPWAVDNADLLARIVNEGHHLINHSWSHPHFPELTSEERAEELYRLEDLVRNEVGVELQPYFRPPFGEYDQATLTDLARNGYTVNVMWTVDTLGWNGLNAAEINRRVMDAAAPGVIVLMHVGIQSQDAIALPEMIRLLRQQGYSFATVKELVDQQRGVARIPGRLPGCSPTAGHCSS